MAYIHLYKDNPTAGGTDGVQVSEGTMANPVTTEYLDTTIGQESSPIKLALRCESGYKTYGNTSVKPVGTNANRWALALDNNGAPGTWTDWGGMLIIPAEIRDTNYIIWAKARADVAEQPQNDVSVKLQVTATIVAA